MQDMLISKLLHQSPALNKCYGSWASLLWSDGGNVGSSPCCFICIARLKI